MATVRDNLQIFNELQTKCMIEGTQALTDEEIKKISVTAIALVPQMAEELLEATKIVKDYEEGMHAVLDLISISGDTKLYAKAITTMFNKVISPMLERDIEN